MVYMPQYYRTAATKLKKELHDSFEEYCEKKGVTISALLKEHIEADLGENKIERGKLEKNDGTSGGKTDSARTENPATGTEKSSEWFW